MLANSTNASPKQMIATNRRIKFVTLAASRLWWKNRKGVFSRYPKKESGSWRESDRGGTRLCRKVYNFLDKGKVFLDRIG
jgi:hypothetical protein